MDMTLADTLTILHGVWARKLELVLKERMKVRAHVVSIRFPFCWQRMFALDEQTD